MRHFMPDAEKAALRVREFFNQRSSKDWNPTQYDGILSGFDDENEAVRAVDAFFRQHGTSFSKEIGEFLAEPPPWKSLVVYEHFAKIWSERINLAEKVIKGHKKSPHFTDIDRLFPTEQFAKATKEVLDNLKEAQVIHLRNWPLEDVYCQPHDNEQPYYETIRFPFSNMLIEFSQPLEVESRANDGRDNLVGFLITGYENHLHRVDFLWQDSEYTTILIGAEELPIFQQMSCDLRGKPGNTEKCGREIAIERYGLDELSAFCPAIVVGGQDFPCPHLKWRSRIVNLLLNTINLLNAKHLPVEDITTPKKRVRQAEKSGISLPRQYRKVELTWWTKPYGKDRSSGTGTGKSATSAYKRRGHFRQYKPGKLTWVHEHLCRADLLKGSSKTKQVYKA